MGASSPETEQPAKPSPHSNKLKRADVDDTTKIGVVGIALNGGAVDQPIQYIVRDPAFVLGATVAIGDVIILSADGAMSPVADLLAGDVAIVMGVATSTSAMKIDFSNPLSAGAVKA
jgi:hypothetical protein